MVLPVPKSWPPEVAELYEPVKKIGEGGFGSVLLAKRKKNDTINSETAPDGDDDVVAMKVVGSMNAAASKQEVGYAHREIEILEELRHPNIMRLLHKWEPDLNSGEATCAAVMALSYAEGPTVHDLINEGGALSIVFSRVVAAQLVDAVAYLHSRYARDAFVRCFARAWNIVPIQYFY